MKSKLTRMVWMAAVGLMMLAVVSSLALTGCDRIASFDKAQAAADAGNINFFGFYTGMPLEDAERLVTRYGLQNARLFENPETHEIYSMEFSLKDVRRITKGPSTFNELAQTVANQVGDLEPVGRDAWEYETIDGVTLTIDKSGVEIRDAPRAEEGEAATKRVAQREWERAQAEIAVSNAKLLEGEERKPGETTTITLPGGATMEMVWCPPGAFMMGRLNGFYDEKPPHQVTLTKGFWMGKTEVTQAQWKSVMGNNRSCNKGDDLPMENVSWNDCQEFCKNTGLQLPTEAQWEYACRAGSTGPYAGTGNLDEMGWYSGNSGRQTHPVGTKQPNAWGLYDMHGNVSEWCADWYGDYHSGAVTDPVTDHPQGYPHRVKRGGSYDGDCASSHRDHSFPTASGCYSGFRLVRTLSN